MARSDGSDVRDAGGTERSSEYVETYLAIARLLGFQCRRNNSPHSEGFYDVLLDGEWYTQYNSEFRAALEFVRYYGFEQEMQGALDAQEIHDR